MTLKELKYKIGEQAESVIASELGMKNRSGKYSCPFGVPHKNEAKGILDTRWEHDHFFCYNCHKGYDVIDLYRSKHGTDWYKELCVLAGVEVVKKSFNTIPPVHITAPQFTGIEYLKSRGISSETMDAYGVTSDDNNLYFNYYTPEGQLVACKHRGIHAKTFNATQGGTSILYGMHMFNQQKVLVICEGEVDSMSMYEIAHQVGATDRWLCSSLPQGAGSLPKVMENCGHWLGMFEQIVIIPDKDEAGDKFKAKAKELLGDYDLFELDLPDKDVNDFYLNADRNIHEIKKYLKVIVPDLLAIEIQDVTEKKEIFHFKSGFPTVDKNWDGLQGEWLSLLSGKRNSGKTLMAKQLLIASAKQRIGCYYFTGEEKIEKEKGKLAMIGYGKQGASVERNGSINGAERFVASTEALTYFNANYAPYIKMIDFTMTGSNIFEQILPDMKRAIKHGVKLFVLDNLMILTNGTSDATQKERGKQITIIQELKKFVNTTNTHIVLIVHPNKGGEDISGATEIQNFADGIMCLNRFDNIGDSDVKDKALATLSERFDGRHVSSLLKFTKGRDDATFYEMGLVFEPTTGRLLDANPAMDKDNYHRDGYYAVERYTKDDVPQYDNQYSSK